MFINRKNLITLRIVFSPKYQFLASLGVLCLIAIFALKYKISTPLMIENPLRSPMVLPLADSMSTNFAA